jgi:predicted AlkP superfamily phosphohydrolase/phosphomutase
MARLLVIGLDGATFVGLEPMVRQGVMPFLGSMMSNGARGNLRSCDPPYTGPGWSSFVTGTNPGKHSNYDVERRTLDFKGIEPVGYHTLTGVTIWDLATQAGLRTVLLNMPVSYPPPALNGMVICGALTPPDTSEFTHPPELAAEIEERFGPYRLDLSWANYQSTERGRMLDDLEAMMDQHEKVFCWALQRDPWDLSVAVLVAPDRIQHSLWQWMGLDGAVPPGGERLRDRVWALFSKIDKTVERLADAAGPDTNIIIVSDHGFGPLIGRVDLNNLLADLGYFKFRSRRGFMDTVGKGLHGLGLRRRHVAALLRPFGFKQEFVASLEGGNRLQGAGSVTDWSQTQAFSLITNGIFVNLNGREPEGIVPEHTYDGLRAELIKKLQSVRDPSTGERVIHRVDRREDIYSGPFLDYAPDLVITEFDERYHFYFFPYNHYTKAFNPPGLATGNHAYDGILIARGPDIRPTAISGARLIDVMPTICRILGLPIPGDVDGRTLTEMLAADTLAVAPPGETPSPSEVTRRTLTKEEKEGLEQRLRGLGYI